MTSTAPNRRLYLDKICTSSHIPIQGGFAGHNTTRIFPDLSHTGISSELAPVKKQYAVTPSAEITPTFKRKTFLIAREIEASSNEFKAQEKFFCKDHKVFLNNILRELERKKTTCGDRRHRLWTAGTKDMPFLMPNNPLRKAAESSLITSSSNRLLIVREKKYMTNMETFQSLLSETPISPVGKIRPSRENNGFSPSQNSKESISPKRDDINHNVPSVSFDDGSSSIGFLEVAQPPQLENPSRPTTAYSDGDFESEYVEEES